MSAFDGFCGAEMVAVLAAAARRTGTSLNQFVRPLTRDPTTWLTQLGQARQPKPQTLARIEALIEGRPLPERAPGGRGLNIGRTERAQLGIAPSGREIRELRSLDIQRAERSMVEERLRISRLAHDCRRPGEPLFAAARRVQQELRHG